jgi:four helix bundle protein
MSRDYHKLKVFQAAHELVKKIYKITKGFPKEELFGLISQMRRAAVSIPANIAEGSARKGKKEYIQFLFNALGSASELEYYIFYLTTLAICLKMNMMYYRIWTVK